MLTTIYKQHAIFNRYRLVEQEVILSLSEYMRKRIYIFGDESGRTSTKGVNRKFRGNDALIRATNENFRLAFVVPFSLVRFF